jgi:hypothetical protein
MVDHADGVIRELICNHQPIYLARFDVIVLHFYYGALLGQVSQIAEAELFS